MSELTPPRWDMSPFFPSLESPEFAAEFDDAVASVAALTEEFDSLQVRRRANPEVDAVFVSQFERITGKVNGLYQRLWTLLAYLGCFTTTDARNEIAQSRESQIRIHYARFDQLITRFVAWVGGSDVDALLSLSEVARAHEYVVRRAQYLARHQMSEAEEALASDLGPSAIAAWARLHGTMTALLSATVVVRGEERPLPMSGIRSLASDPDREVRRAAFEAELKAWETVEVPIAAALNGVKGYQSTIRKRRGYSDDVEPTLCENGIDAPTLAAMQQACNEALPDFRRYLTAKARALGVPRLAWYDVIAPIGETKRWTWAEADSFVQENFGRFSSRLADFARRAFSDGWIDAEPRIGKEGGGYCTSLQPGVSRVMMNFDGSFTSVSTLAHELGHAYHNLNLKDRTVLQRETPSTLAETASIFSETLTFDAALERAAPQERLAILDTSLQRDLAVVVDIHSRFLFERAVFERRGERDLTIAEFKSLMTEAQRATYGEVVEPLHPYMWAVKGHYYGPTFYNYPYTFGLLFALGLYTRFKQSPDNFRAEYDDLLSSTGMADARTLAARFGIDITNVAFWRSSLDVVRNEVRQFEEIVGA